MKVFMAKTKKIYLILILLLFIGAGAILSSSTSREAIVRFFSRPIPTYAYNIVNSWPHDTTSFTEGLVITNGILYESAGRNGSSSLRIVDLKTGSIKTKVDLPDQYFAEGITVLNGKIFQLTWLNKKGFIYDQSTLSLIGEFSYESEGWGLTDDGHFLIMSNGTNAITFLDPDTFQTEKIINVYNQDEPLVYLNELEYVKGEIYANIWHSDKIVRIDPGSGKILGWIDLVGLFPIEERQEKEAVLNGIAYDQTNDRLFVTGKLWPRLFEITLEEEPSR
jgi:glutaminyl-peptide cyclotransferase